MFEITYIYLIILGCLFAYKTLANDPDRAKIWGPNKTADIINQQQKEIKLLKTQLEHYQNHLPAPEKLNLYEESVA